MVFYNCLVLGSIILLVITYDPNIDIITSDESNNDVNDASNSTASETNLTSTKNIAKISDNNYTTDLFVILLIDRIITYIFFMEILIRFIVCPKKLKFFKNVFNWIDIIAIMPWTLLVIMIQTSHLETADFILQAEVQIYIKVASTLRVIRLISLARHHVASLVFLVTLWESRKEILLLMSLYITYATFFAVAVYFVEEGKNDDFSSMAIGIWWAIITMSTVGYGDIYPNTELGKTLGIACAFSGVIATALPVAVISTNYGAIYRAAKVRQRLKEKTSRD